MAGMTPSTQPDPQGSTTGRGRHGRHGRHATIDDGRDESANERADRNWGELLQELRVMQTGVQILTGFLLTLPFQPAFADLDDYQVRLYTVLVTLSVATTGTLIAPVSVHRALFRRRLKSPLVTASDRIARVGLLLLALVMAGTAMLAFDIVVSRWAGAIVAASALTLLFGLWVLLPWSLTRRHG